MWEGPSNREVVYNTYTKQGARQNKELEGGYCTDQRTSDRSYEAILPADLECGMTSSLLLGLREDLVFFVKVRYHVTRKS